MGAVRLSVLLCLLTAGCPHQGGEDVDRVVDRGVRLDEPTPRPEWPAFPANKRAARALVARSRQRRVEQTKERSLEQAIADVVAGRRRVVAGRERIHEYLGRILAKAPNDAYLLWGVYHDAGGQVAAFRRLIGSGGVGGLTHVVVEQFDASGFWGNVSAEQQTGDDDLILAYLKRGDARAFKQLEQRQRRLDYTAWKYGYLDGVMELLAVARARGLSFSGCDMPRSLQRRLSSIEQEFRDRVRELHCLQNLRGRRAGIERVRVAMIWGQSHLLSTGMMQFVPQRDRVVRVVVYGHRQGPLTPEARLANQGLMLTSEALVLAPDAEPMTLLLPGPRLGAKVDRARDPLHGKHPPAGRSRLVVSSDVAGTLQVGTERGQQIKVDRKQRVVLLAEGQHSFVFKAGKRTIVGRLPLPASGELRLELDCRARQIRLVVRHPVKR